MNKKEKKVKEGEGGRGRSGASQQCDLHIKWTLHRERKCVVPKSFLTMMHKHSPSHCSLPLTFSSSHSSATPSSLSFFLSLSSSLSFFLSLSSSLSFFLSLSFSLSLSLCNYTPSLLLSCTVTHRPPGPQRSADGRLFTSGPVQ